MNPDLSRFRDAVRLRDRCREAAMAHHERCGLAPSFAYANATFDAIVDLIREDERCRVATERATTNDLSTFGSTAMSDKILCRKWVGPIWKLDGETCVCTLLADHSDGRFGEDHECSCGAWFVDAVAHEWSSGVPQ